MGNPFAYQQTLGVQRLTLDIETGFASDADLAIEAAFVKPAGNIKDPAKKARNLEEKVNGLSEKDGVLDVNPIACIGVKADGLLLHFSTFAFSPEFYQSCQSAGIRLFSGNTEAEMLHTFGGLMSALCTPHTRIISFNGKGFDLPKIRLAFARNRLPLPLPFALYAPNYHTDVMCEFGYNFTVNPDRKRFVSLEAVAALLRIPFKKSMSGADVPAAIERGDVEAVTLYNLQDVITTAQAADILLAGAAL